MFWKDAITENKPIAIKGLGTNSDTKTKAVIGRTNWGLLLKAIEYVTEKKNIKQIYFEGNFNSYTYANEGASLYDVLNLQNNKRALIKDALIKLELVRSKYGETNKPWKPEQDEKLAEMFNNNNSDSEIIKYFGRNAGAIRSRLRKLGLK